MAISTYDELKEAIADWTVRTDLGARIDDFIDLAEAMFRNPPRPPDDADIGGVRIGITTETGALTASQDYIAKPSDMMTPLSLDLTGTNGGRLTYIANDSMPTVYREGTGMPKYWTVTDNIDFDVSPDSTYSYELKYYANVTPLSSSNTTNTILTDYPNVYLSGSLYYAYDYIGDDANANKWLARYKAYAWSASMSYRAENLTSGSLAARVA